MAAKKSITQNYIYNVLYQLLTILTPLITTPYVSRILGSSGVGQYELTQANVQYFILAGTIGLNMYGQREVAYVQNSKEKRSEVFWELTILRVATMAVSMAVYACFIPFTGVYRLLYLIQFLDLLANMWDVAWFFQGMEEFRLTVLRNVIIRLAGIACIFLFVKKSGDVWLYVMAHSLPLLIASLSLWTYLRKYIIWPGKEKIRIKRHIKPALALFIPQIAAQIYLVMDKTMIGAITGSDSEVAYYAQAQKIVKMLLTVVTSLCTVMLPRMSFAFAQKEYKKIQEYMQESFAFAYILAVPMVFGIIGVSDNFVPVFFGEGYDKVKILMPLLSPIIIWIAFSNIIGYQYLLPSQKQTQYTISITAGAVTNFILNSCLISRFQSIGASVATVIAELVVTGVQLYFVRNEFTCGTLLKNSIKFLISGITMMAVVLAIGRYIHGVKGIAVQVAVGTVVYAVGLLVLREKTIWKIIEKGKNRR